MAFVIPKKSSVDVQLQPMQNARMQNMDVSGGIRSIAQGLDNASSAISQTGLAIDRHQQRVDDAIVTERYNQLNGELSAFSTGFLSRKGSETFNWQKDFEDGYAKQYQTATKGLNEDQIQRFNALAEPKKNIYSHQIHTHSLAESEKYIDEQHNTSILNAVDFAINNYDDEAAQEKAETDLHLNILSKYNGQPVDFQNEKLKEQYEKIRLGTLQKILDSGDPLKAREYYNNNIEDIGANNRIKIDSVIKESEDNKLVNDNINYYLIGDKSMSNVNKSIREDKDIPDNLKSQVIKGFTKIKKQQIDDLKFQKAQESYAIQESVGKMLSSESPTEVQKKINSMTDLNKRATAQKAYDATTNNIKTDPNIAFEIDRLRDTNPERFKLIDMTDAIELNGLGKVDLSTVISQADMKKYIQDQNDLKIGKQPQNRSVERAANKLVKDLGLDGDEAIQFSESLRQQVKVNEANSGKTMGEFDTYELGKSLYSKTPKTKGFIGFSSKKVYQLTNEEIGELTIADVDLDEVPAMFKSTIEESQLEELGYINDNRTRMEWLINMRAMRGMDTKTFKEQLAKIKGAYKRQPKDDLESTYRFLGAIK